MIHLSLKQRYEIEAYLKVDYGFAAIGRKIERERSVVSREIDRNGGRKRYDADKAMDRYLKGRKRSPYKLNKTMKEQIEEGICSDKSPEQIVGESKRKMIPMVSHEIIYQYVYSEKQQGGSLYTHLRHQHKKRRKRSGSYSKRGQIKNRTPISQRPVEVENRTTFGHWEGDLVLGTKSKGVMITLVERKSGYTRIKKVASKQEAVVSQGLIEMIQDNQLPVITLTLDNGKEFAGHQKVTQATTTQIFFANPYHSWERGTNENTNGLIRQYFPKGYDFSDEPENKFRNVEDKLNNRPRKRLDFLSPIEFINEKFDALNVAFQT